MANNIVLICGYKKTGKDFLFNFLTGKLSDKNIQLAVYTTNYDEMSYYDMKIIQSFKTYLRQAFADELKKEVELEFPLCKKDIPDSDKEKTIPEYEKSARTIWIEKAKIRRKEDIDYWCKKIDHNIDSIITDFRYHTEFKYCFENFNKINTIRYFRKEVEIPPFAKDIKDDSEHNLDNFTTDFLIVPFEDKEEHFRKACEIFPQYKKFGYSFQLNSDKI